MKVLERKMNVAPVSGCIQDHSNINEEYGTEQLTASKTQSEARILATCDEGKSNSVALLINDPYTTQPSTFHYPTSDQIELSAPLLAHKELESIAALDIVVQDNVAMQSVLPSELGNEGIESSSHVYTITAQQITSDDGVRHHPETHASESQLPDSTSDSIHLRPPTADNGVKPGTSVSLSSKSKPFGNLRRGKWTAEEESYVARVIQDFNSGYLDAPAGTTLRTYLSEKLKCDPMRITKKFTGESCIGKRVFHPAVRNISNAAIIDKAQVCDVEFFNVCDRFVICNLTRCHFFLS
jgi:hypothetical protein